MAGRLIAFTALMAFIGWLLRHEIRNYWESRHAVLEPIETPPIETPAERELKQSAEAMRDELDYFAELCGQLAPTAADIAALHFFRADDWQVTA